MTLSTATPTSTPKWYIYICEPVTVGNIEKANRTKPRGVSPCLFCVWAENWDHCLSFWEEWNFSVYNANMMKRFIYYIRILYIKVHMWDMTLLNKSFHLPSNSLWLICYNIGLPVTSMVIGLIPYLGRLWGQILAQKGLVLVMAFRNTGEVNKRWLSRKTRRLSHFLYFWRKNRKPSKI